jgi:hypothetical protein
MPIWFELLVLALLAYVAGFALGWVLWAHTTDEGAGLE